MRRALAAAAETLSGRGSWSNADEPQRSGESLDGAGHLAPQGPRKTALRAAARDEDLKGMTGAGGGFLLSARRAMTNAGYVVVTVQASTACVLFRGTR